MERFQAIQAMPGKTVNRAALAAVCTLLAVRPAAAHATIDVAGLDGRAAAVSLAGLEVWQLQ